MSGKVVIGTELDTKSFEVQMDNLIDKLETLQEEYKLALKDKDFPEEELRKYREEIEKTTNKLKDLNKKQNDLNKNGISNLGRSMSNVVKSVTKWGLAIFGVRSTYMFIRQSMSVLSQENKQLASDIQYIRYALASSMQPVIEVIVGLVFKLLGLIQSIIYAFTGKNVFENANKGLKGAVSSAKQLKKVLTGFDEMNILQDTSSGGGAGGGSIAPSVDLSKIIDEEQGQKVKSWWDNILQFWNGDLVETFAKINDNFKFFWSAVGKGFEGFWDFIKGTVNIIKGIFQVLYGLFTSNFEKVKEGLNNLLDGLLDLIIGTAKMVITPISMAIGIIIDLFRNAFNFLKENIIEPIGNFFVNLWNKISSGASNSVSKIKNFFSSIPTYFNNIISKIKSTFENIGSKAGEIVGSAFKTVINGVLKTVQNVLNAPIKAINKLLDKINDVPGIKLTKLSTFSFPKLAKGGIINMPGRGVAIGGEAGQEGVIPLTDSQQMQLLGEAIGRYITINANITNTMNGRVISRELQKINNENSFANNR